MDGYAGVGLGLPDCQVDSETAPWVGRGFVQSESRDEHPRQTGGNNSISILYAVSNHPATNKVSNGDADSNDDERL